jgi:predicted transcriptional regulator
LSVAPLPKYIEELKTRTVDTLISTLVESSPDVTLSKILGLLKDRGVYEVFLPEGTRCGMISERELLKTTSIEATKTSALVSYVPVLRKDAQVGEAARLMADYRIRAAPISDGRKIIGQVNCATLLRELKGRISADLRITSLAKENPITIKEDDPVAKAKELLVRKRIDHLPVIKNKRIVGLLTSSHIILRLKSPERVGSKSMRAQTRGSLDFRAGDAMDTDPLTCPPETSADEALASILKAAKTCIMITQWEELQAISTQREFMSLLSEVEPEPDVPVFIVGLPDNPFESEATKTKFKRVVNQLYKVLPDILEARSVIKSKHKAGRERGRYEVTVQIRTPKNSFSYSEEGWELPALYDLITDRLKRLMTHKQKPGRIRQRGSSETA